MSKNEVYTYLKSLSDMNIVQNEINRRDRIIADRDNLIAVHVNALAQKDNVIAQKDKEIAGYRRRLGLK